jgi:hypothetical protein
MYPRVCAQEYVVEVKIIVLSCFTGHFRPASDIGRWKTDAAQRPSLLMKPFTGDREILV